MKHKTITALLLTFLCLLSLFSCAPSSSTDQATTTTTTTQGYTQPSKTGVIEGVSVFNNIDYTIYLPSSYKVGTDIPLLVALHGGGQGTRGEPNDNRQFFADYTGLNSVAEKYGFAVVYPRQSIYNNYGYDYWNWYIQQSQTSKEPSSLYKIVNEVKGAYSIDDSRVFICGLSAGAAMAQIMAINFNTTFAGCCAVAGITFQSGSMYQTDELQSFGPSIENSVITNNIYNALGDKSAVTKLLVVTGTNDTRVNPKNSLVMAQTWTDAMKRINSDISTELKTESSIGVNDVEFRKSVYATLGDEELCTLYEVVGMEHSWPGSNMGISISISSGKDLGYKGGIDLNEVMCEFFGLNK